MDIDGIQKIKIGGLQKSSLIDYPGQISAIVFTQGCNFHCPYCHNPELISAVGASDLTALSVLDFLKTRVGKLDAVVVTGGEPCLQQGLEEFILQVKSLGFLVKLDTNGSCPDVLKKMLESKLLDYVAMDIKAPIDKYSEVACCKIDTSSILKSVSLLKNSGIDYEFRTTVVKSQISIEDFKKIAELIGGESTNMAQKYYLQKFVPTKTLNPLFLEQETYTDAEFEEIKTSLAVCIKEVYVR